MEQNTEVRSLTVDRRDALKLFAASGATVAFGAWQLPAKAGQNSGRVVVVGGGFGGATAAKYIKRLDPLIDVTLVEPAARFYTCPFTNLYFAGIKTFDGLGHDFDELRHRYGVSIVAATAEDVDADGKSVTLSDGSRLPYDRLVLSPGVDMDWQALAGYDEAASAKAPHAWKAGPQTHLLKQQLEAMADGGLFVLSAPANPFRCPPGPYERVAMVAHYLKTHKPRSKILVLDAKDAFSKQPLFRQGWREIYGDMIEWVGQSDDGRVVRVDAERRIVETEFGERHQADVLNVVPPQKAGFIASRAGVTDASGWVPVKPDTFESELVDDIYVVGDATVAAPMPKSGFCANAQGKVTAMAIVSGLAEQPMPAATWINTCYSLIAPDYGISVAGVYRVVDGEIVEVAGGISPLDASPEFRRREARNAVAWYNAISQDTWGTRRDR
jgi:sulfide dehydrogenase [flavocytochrome c] flavoprotein chain